MARTITWSRSLRWKASSKRATKRKIPSLEWSWGGTKRRQWKPNSLLCQHMDWISNKSLHSSFTSTQRRQETAQLRREQVRTTLVHQQRTAGCGTDSVKYCKEAYKKEMRTSRKTNEAPRRLLPCVWHNSRCILQIVFFHLIPRLVAPLNAREQGNRSKHYRVLKRLSRYQTQQTTKWKSPQHVQLGSSTSEFMMKFTPPTMNHHDSFHLDYLAASSSHGGSWTSSPSPIFSLGFVNIIEDVVASLVVATNDDKNVMYDSWVGGGGASVW